MNMTQFARPTLVARPSFIRFTDLNDELDRLVDTSFAALTRSSQSAAAWSPALEVYEDKENFVVHADLPGFKREDVEVSLHDGTLTLSGERKAEPRRADAEVYRAERYIGRFLRAVGLPATVATEKVKASYSDGVLTVTLPKTEEAKPKKIDVSVN
jgi:HSP20 family protein